MPVSLHQGSNALVVSSTPENLKAMRAIIAFMDVAPISEAATVKVERPDDILTELWATKAVILEKLGRKEEAAEVGRRSKEAATPESTRK